MIKIKKEEVQTNNEVQKTKKTKVSADKKKGIGKFLIIGGLIIAFVLGILVAVYFNSQSSEKLETKYKNDIDKLEAQITKLTAEKESALALVSSEKGTLVAQNEKLELENENLVSELSLLDGMLSEISNENKEVESITNYYYKITWDEYIIARPGKQFTTTVSLENIGSRRRTYNLDVRLRSSYKDAITTTPSDGSLTLAEGSSGNINLEFKPVQEGYAIFGLYVNGHHAGDVVVFVREP